MENKYYTPDKDEFCDGFEYEFSFDGGDWEKCKFSISSGEIDEMAGDWYEFHPNCPKTICRVKHIDSDDIESLGWEKSTHVDVVCYKHKNKLLFWHEKPFISINCLDQDDVQLFRGSIKNKHEFKKLMKQLGIK